MIAWVKLTLGDPESRARDGRRSPGGPGGDQAPRAVAATFSPAAQGHLDDSS